MLKFLKIRGDSLAPDFSQGDFVLVSKIPYFFSRPRQGEVIAFHQPGYGLLIKRIDSVEAEGQLLVRGTMPDSVDSRIFGPVQPANILGRVIWHIRKT
jgi:nickel-type superoxide dismutase maturation protease